MKVVDERVKIYSWSEVGYGKVVHLKRAGTNYELDAIILCPDSDLEYELGLDDSADDKRLIYCLNDKSAWKIDIDDYLITEVYSDATLYLRGK